METVFFDSWLETCAAFWETRHLRLQVGHGFSGKVPEFRKKMQKKEEALGFHRGPDLEVRRLWRLSSSTVGCCLFWLGVGNKTGGCEKGSAPRRFFMEPTPFRPPGRESPCRPIRTPPLIRLALREHGRRAKGYP